MRRLRAFGRRFSALGKIALALASLAVLWVGTVTAVEKTTRASDERRMTDRLLWTKGLAGAVTEWLGAGQKEVADLAGKIGGESGAVAQGVLDAHTASGSRFARDAILVDQKLLVLAASRGRSGLVGGVPAACRREGAVDEGLRETAGAAKVGVAISRLFAGPGECLPTVAVAAAARSGVVVLLADPSDALARLAAARHLDEGTRAFLTDPSGELLEPGNASSSAPPELAKLIAEAKGGPLVRRYSIGDARIVGAYQPAVGGWGVVLEQDAATFDIEAQARPAVTVAFVLTLVFAAVFLLLAFFDVRRARAHRRAEVAKDTFLSIAGHELRTPLTVIRGFAETLSARWDDIDEPKRRTLVNNLVPQTRRLSRVIQRVLTASNIQANKHASPRTTMLGPDDLADVLGRVADRFRPEAPLHDFRVLARAGGWQTRADPALLEQILEHLVDNAVKYSPKGGVVRLSAEPSRRRMTIAVEDEGVGLPSDARRIFELFAQGESVDKRVHDEGGAGLGLFIVRRLTQDMGGRVHAERLERGARFVIELRAERSREREAALAN